jgi:hypothetical protein
MVAEDIVLYFMSKNLNRIMGEFIGEYNWDIFCTLTYKNGCKEYYNRVVMENYYQKNKNLIKRMFFVSERNKNYKDVHSHFLISTDSVELLINKNKSLHKFGHIHNVVIDKNKFVTEDGVLTVGYYVSKFFDKNVDWGISHENTLL